jgi:hypothetical protein
MVCLHLQGELPNILVTFIDGVEGDDVREGNEIEEDPFDATFFLKHEPYGG